jgi:hypothetical protein
MAKYSEFQYGNRRYGVIISEISKPVGRRTYPDYGTYDSTIISPDIDLAELGARQGTPRFRREGRVLVYADFSPSLDGIETNVPGGGIQIIRSANYAFIGEASLLFFGVPGNTPFIDRTTPITDSLRIGLECAIYNAVEFNMITLEIQYYLIDRLTKTAVRVKGDTGTIEFLNNAGAWQNVIGGVVPLQATNRWIDLKLVADANSLPVRYARFMVNNTIYEMNPEGYSLAPTIELGINTQIKAESADGINDFAVYVDTVIVTTNED